MPPPISPGRRRPHRGLNYCDDARKNGQKRKQLQERVDELEVEAEVWQEEREDMA